MTQQMVIAIDGPAGSGKSTIARRLARELGFIALDSGSVYRIITLAMLRQQMTPGNAFAEWFLSLEADVITLTDGVASHLNGKPISMEELKAPKVHAFVSQVSEHPSIRQLVNGKLREHAEDRSGIVCEGRDAGTFIFPDASIKFYLTAKLVIRARRIGLSISAVRARDRNDHGKAVGALPSLAEARKLGYHVIHTDGREPLRIVTAMRHYVERNLPLAKS